MKRAMGWLLLAALVGSAARELRADFMEYILPGGGSAILLQGKATVNAGKTVTFRHVNFKENLFFKLENVKIYKVRTTGQQFQTRLGKAVGQKDAGAVFEAGVWALKHGMLAEYYSAVDKALALDPSHEESKRIKALKYEMDKPLGDPRVEEEQLRRFVPRKEMKIATSKHFILLYDTPDKPEEGRGRKPRHQQRLELLEQVYESFLLTFFSRGVDLEVPQERLQVVLFNNYADFRDFSTRLDAQLIHAAGFYLPETNISFFFDHSTYEPFLELEKESKKLDRLAADLRRERVRGAGEIVSLARTLGLLVEIAQESQDVEVVSHEATHQLAGNTGLFPRHVRVPSWVHEGLAAYFESPNDGAWSGIGAVNERRIGYYRALEPDREHSNIDFIVGDQIFDYAGSVGATLHGYGQAWALTHFLMERHFDEFIAYYKLIGEMPRDMILPPDALTTAFNKVFGEDREALDISWRSYMRSLKTDIEVVLEDR